MSLGGFTKLFSRILTSSIWSESNEVRIVWITLLAATGPDGLVRVTVPGLARLAALSLAETQKAIEILTAPDQYSRTVQYEGRRLREERDSEGNLIGFHVFNYMKYRALDTTAAERQRNFRRRRKEPIIAALIARDGKVCGICAQTISADAAILDHIIPRAAGGLDTLDNLQLVHPPCNGAKCDGRGQTRDLRHSSLPSTVTNVPRYARQKTEDRRQKTETATERISAPVVAVPKPAPWSREACDDWQRRFEGTAPGGRIGKALKPLVEKHGWAEVRSAWRSYLEATEPEFASPSRFANTYGSWNGTSAPAVAPKDKARLDSMTAFIRGGMRDEKRELGTGNGAVDAGILPGRPSSGS